MNCSEILYIAANFQIFMIFVNCKPITIFVTRLQKTMQDFKNFRLQKLQLYVGFWHNYTSLYNTIFYQVAS